MKKNLVITLILVSMAVFTSCSKKITEPPFDYKVMSIIGSWSDESNGLGRILVFDENVLTLYTAPEPNFAGYRFPIPIGTYIIVNDIITLPSVASSEIPLETTGRFHIATNTPYHKNKVLYLSDFDIFYANIHGLIDLRRFDLNVLWYKIDVVDL